MSAESPFEFKPEYENPDHPIEVAAIRGAGKRWSVLFDSLVMAGGAVLACKGVENNNKITVALGMMVGAAALTKELVDLIGASRADNDRGIELNKLDTTYDGFQAAYIKYYDQSTSEG